MDKLTNTIHNLMASPLAGFVLPGVVLAVVLLVALVVGLNKARLSTERNRRRSYLRSVGISGRNIQQQITKAQWELRAARQNKRACENYPLMQADAAKRVTAAQFKLMQLESYAR